MPVFQFQLSLSPSLHDFNVALANYIVIVLVVMLFCSILCTCMCSTTARVMPEKITTNSQALNTNVQWKFAYNVESRIKEFIIEVTPGGDGGEGCVPLSVSTGPKNRFAALSYLKPSTTYRVKVVAEYEDGFRAKSKDHGFTTTGILPFPYFSIVVIIKCIYL